MPAPATCGPVIAAWIEEKTSKCRLRPVIDRTSVTSGDGAGQPQESAEKSGTAIGGHQHRKASRVRVTYRGQVDDEPAVGRSEHRKELLAHHRSGSYVEFAAERGNETAALGARGKTEAISATSGRVQQSAPIMGQVS